MGTWLTVLFWRFKFTREQLSFLSIKWCKPTQIWQEKILFEKKTSIMLTYRQVCGSILSDDWCRKSQALRQCHLWAGCPGVHKRINWVSQEKEANKPHTFLFWFQVLSSCLSLSSYFDFNGLSVVVWWNKTFPPLVDCSWCFITDN